MQVFQIGQVARRTGLTVDAIRFYEKAGLLARPARSVGGYRLYHDRDVADLEFIQSAQRLGFSLNQIRELFSIQRHPQQACPHVRDLIAKKLAAVRSKLEELRRLETGLAHALEQCETTLLESGEHQACCPVLEEIAAGQSRGRKR